MDAVCLARFRVSSLIKLFCYCDFSYKAMMPNQKELGIIFNLFYRTKIAYSG